MPAPPWSFVVGQVVSPAFWDRNGMLIGDENPVEGDATPLNFTSLKPVRRYCVFNKTRESFLALNVARADTHIARLKGLLGTLRLNSDQGIWVTPSQGVHTIGLRFAIDLVYLDANYRVIELVESFGTFRIGPLRMNCSSVLELPSRAIYHSHTQVKDELLICLPQELEYYLKGRKLKEDGPAASISAG
jgi:uncharacterized protein